MIIGQREKRIRYVDCFAGPWQEGSDDLRDTSISISLKIMKECHEGLLQRSKDVHFRALYIEKNRKAYNKLKTFHQMESTDEVKANSVHGEFFPLRDNIVQWCGKDDFTFFFIDPSGWKHVVEPLTLRSLLQRQRSEFLINFMFEFVRRA
ncbi:MAG: three-Cys-motif partner protein TcmP, partial [Desulfobacteraceae bacterium]